MVEERMESEPTSAYKSLSELEEVDKLSAERKLAMCYMMALGLDDVEMMARAACLAPNSVKSYRKECRELLDSLPCNKSYI